MELKDMPSIVLMIVVLGIVIGIGVLILDQFGNSMKVSTTLGNETIGAVSAGVGTTDNDDVTGISEIYNTSHLIISNNISASSLVNLTSTGFNIDTAYNGHTLNVSYTYLRDTATTTALFGTRDAVDDFVTWLPVIIIILAAAIILGLVMRGFRQ